MILYINNIKVPAISCKRPRFNNGHRGRTWDYGSIYIDDVEYNAHLDTTWGRCIYIQYGPNLKWYRINMWSDILSDLKGETYDVDPFDAKTKLYTKKQ